MVSISSSKNIRDRTQIFCRDINNWFFVINSHLFDQINEFLNSEYALIPKIEKIRKGMVFISKYVAKTMVLFIKNNLEKENDFFIKIITQGFNFGEILEKNHFCLFILLFLSEFVNNFPNDFQTTIHLNTKIRRS